MVEPSDKRHGEPAPEPEGGRDIHECGGLPGGAKNSVRNLGLQGVCGDLTLISKSIAKRNKICGWKETGNEGRKRRREGNGEEWDRCQSQELKWTPCGGLSTISDNYKCFKFFKEVESRFIQMKRGQGGKIKIKISL